MTETMTHQRSYSK